MKRLVTLLLATPLLIAASCGSVRNPLSSTGESRFRVEVINQTTSALDVIIQSENRGPLQPGEGIDYGAWCPSRDKEIVDPRRDGRCSVRVRDTATGEIAGGTFRVEADEPNVLVAKRVASDRLELDDERRF